MTEGERGLEAELPRGPETEVPEALRPAYRELYTVEGAGFITEVKEAIQSADIERIRLAVEKATGFMEGLYFGIDADDYDLDDLLVAGEIQDMFTSIEGSLDRPSYGQVFFAVRHGLTEAVNEANEFNKHKKRGEEGVVEWRDRLRKSREEFWKSISTSYREQGLSGLTEDRIKAQADEDVKNQEIRVRKWLESKNELVGLKDHVDARILVFDKAFQERQKSCEAEEAWTQSWGNFVKPDKGHWMAYYWGNRRKDVWEREGKSEWGDAVSRVEMAIEKIARGELPILDREGRPLQDNPLEGWFVRDIYTNGFRNTAEFVAWLRTLLKESKINGQERMDVVWAAWRMSLWKERITKLAWKVELKEWEADSATGRWKLDSRGYGIKNKNFGRYTFGNPPFASDQAQKAIHNDKMRSNELGWTAVVVKGEERFIIDWDEKKRLKLGKDAKVVGEEALTEQDFTLQPQRYREFRAISHAGHPLSVGRVGRLSEDFMSFSKVGGWIPPGENASLPEISLYEIWYIRGISMGSKNFPWASTELREPGQPADEPPAGSAGLWFLQRWRASEVRNKYLREIPPPGQLTIEFFQACRNWEKLGLIKPGALKDKDNVPQNSFAWYLAGIIRARTMYPKDNPYTREDRGYRSKDLQNKTMPFRKSKAAPGTISDYDILENARTVGCISPDEENWIGENFIMRSI